MIKIQLKLVIFRMKNLMNWRMYKLQKSTFKFRIYYCAENGEVSRFKMKNANCYTLVLCVSKMHFTK